MANKAVIFNTVISMTTPGIRMSDRDHLQNLGAAMDELVRHHPTLRPIVSEAVSERVSALSQGDDQLQRAMQLIKVGTINISN